MLTYWYFMIIGNYTTDHSVNYVGRSRLFEFLNSYIFIGISYVVRPSYEYVSIQFFTVNAVVFISFISYLHSDIYNATICKNITKLQIFYRDCVTI